jgi:hypothetical protein
MTAEIESAGDTVPPNCEPIEVHVSELSQLFNSMDPSPFHEKDLDPEAEEFIVGWAREVHGDRPFCLMVYLDRSARLPEDPGVVLDALQRYFRRRAQASRRRVRQLFRVGRTSLLIGLGFLALSIGAGDFAAGLLSGRAADIARESLLIGGWVAMWRPLEIFLYDWWPISAEARLFDRLGRLSVRILHAGSAR